VRGTIDRCAGRAQPDKLVHRAEAIAAGAQIGKERAEHRALGQCGVGGGEVLVALDADDVVGVDRMKARMAQRAHEQGVAIEPDVGVVEQTLGGVLPLAERELATDVGVRDVGGADHDVGRMQVRDSRDRPKCRIALDQVLQRVEEADRVQPARADRLGESLERRLFIGQDELLRLEASLPQALDPRGIGIHAEVGHPERAGERLGDAAIAAADVEVELSGGVRFREARQQGQRMPIDVVVRVRVVVVGGWVLHSG